MSSFAFSQFPSQSNPWPNLLDLLLWTSRLSTKGSYHAVKTTADRISSQPGLPLLPEICFPADLVSSINIYVEPAPSGK